MKDPLLLNFGERNATENFNFSFGERTEVWRSCSTVFKARVFAKTCVVWSFLTNSTPYSRWNACIGWLHGFICNGKETNKSSSVRAPQTIKYATVLDDRMVDGNANSDREALNKAWKMLSRARRWFAIPILFWNMWNIPYARRENSFVFWYRWYVWMSQVSIDSLAPLGGYIWAI